MALGGWGAVVALVLLLVLSGIVAIRAIRGRSDVEPAGYKKLAERLGVNLSTHIEPEHIDKCHRYTVFHRTDLLDYPSGNFYSIRRIHGVNLSEGSTAFLPYVEHSERKVAFFDCRVRAFDINTQEELRVEPFEPDGRKRFAVAFKIFFANSIRPGQRFNIVFAITLPGELDDLHDADEVMSLFLGRIEKGVDKLLFRVCLNFRPTVAFGECVDRKNETAPLDATVMGAAAYTPSEWFEKKLDCNWSAPPFVVSLVADQPRYPLYILHYKR